MRRGREFSVHVAQNVSGVSFGPPGVLLKFGIGFAASSKSRLRRGSASASLSVTAGVCDWKEAIGLCVREVCLKIARQPAGALRLQARYRSKCRTVASVVDFYSITMHKPFLSPTSTQHSDHDMANPNILPLLSIFRPSEAAPSGLPSRGTAAAPPLATALGKTLGFRSGLPMPLVPPRWWSARSASAATSDSAVCSATENSTFVSSVPRTPSPPPAM